MINGAISDHVCCREYALIRAKERQVKERVREESVDYLTWFVKGELYERVECALGVFKVKVALKTLLYYYFNNV